MCPQRGETMRGCDSGGRALWLMTTLDLATWARFLGWMVVGRAVYFLYSRRRSRLAQDVGG